MQTLNFGIDKIPPATLIGVIAQVTGTVITRNMTWLKDVLDAHLRELENTKQKIMQA